MIAIPERASPGRYERFVPLVLVVVVLVAAIVSITPWPVGAYEDDAIYTLLAKSLASGDGHSVASQGATFPLVSQ